MKSRIISTLAAFSLLLFSAGEATAQQLVPVTNGGSGTTVGLLTTLSAGTAITATTSSFFDVYGVMFSGAGTSGTGYVAISGPASCQVDAGGIAAGHYAIASITSAGKCGDGGANYPITSAPVGIAPAAITASTTGTITVLPPFQTVAPYRTCVVSWGPGQNLSLQPISFCHVGVSATLTNVYGRVDTAEGGAATIQAYSAPSGTACASGTSPYGALTTASFNANGTANTGVGLTVQNTALTAPVDICIVGTGFGTTNGSGMLQVTATVP